ncbi:MAG: hypothetical protein ACYTAF_00435, partial [Planctomycetota bacterium]
GAGDGLLETLIREERRPEPAVRGGPHYYYHRHPHFGYHLCPFCAPWPSIGFTWTYWRHGGTGIGIRFGW